MSTSQILSFWYFSFFLNRFLWHVLQYSYMLCRSLNSKAHGEIFCRELPRPPFNAGYRWPVRLCNQWGMGTTLGHGCPQRSQVQLLPWALLRYYVHHPYTSPSSVLPHQSDLTVCSTWCVGNICVLSSARIWRASFHGNNDIAWFYGVHFDIHREYTSHKRSSAIVNQILNCYNGWAWLLSCGKLIPHQYFSSIVVCQLICAARYQATS